ncbi:hypothetical protein B0H14DRAFT_2574363 [Mycena olivaceomarginata]|nr:hypothetical protein B0H14DRAFT_2574363 [Mycena olivaceomarginata]
MPPSAVIQNRLENVVTCLTMATDTMQIMADSMKTPFLGAIINTTQVFLENVQVLLSMPTIPTHLTVTKHKEESFQLLEQIHKLVNAIMILHIKSDAGGIGVGLWTALGSPRAGSNSPFF